MSHTKNQNSGSGKILKVFRFFFNISVCLKREEHVFAAVQFESINVSHAHKSLKNLALVHLREH